MSVWKSPVLYIGLILVLLVGGALLAPFIVDWDAYRDGLESYGRKISGRAVAIDGPIKAKLFPWPVLEAEDVSLGNPKGFDNEPMLTAGKVTVHLALAGLMSGEIRVESIDVEKPVLRLAIDAYGNGNWHFEPDRALASTGLLNNVLLQQINFKDGKLVVKDTKHGFSHEIAEATGIASAATLEGPWRLKAAAKDQDVPLEFSWSSLAWKKGTPIKFGFKLTPQDGVTPSFAFDGQGDNGHFVGRLAVEPVVMEDGRTSLIGSLKPLTYHSKIDVEGDVAKLDEIRIVAADPKDNGTLIEGGATLDLAHGAQATIRLTAPHVDLDGLAGDRSLRVWRAGGAMALLNSLMTNIPASLEVSASIDANALTAAGQSLENISLHASAQKDAIRIQDLSADLPGRSRLKFNGIVFPGPDAADLGGSLAFESNDTRTFATWLWPEGKVEIERVWTGARGRLKTQSDVSWGGKRFGFQNLNYELDGLGGKAELSVTLGQLPALDLRLTADRFDLGSYVSGGLAGLATSNGLLAALPSSSGFEKRIQMSFGQLTLNGVDAEQVALGFNSSSSGFEVKDLSIGSVQGAEVKGEGLVLMGPDGPSGNVKLTIGAERPQGLLRLLGLFPKGPDPLWAQSLGHTDMGAELAIKPGENEPLVNYSINGASGPFRVIGSGTIDGLSKGLGASAGFSGTVSSAEASDLARIFGVQMANADAGEGSLSLTASGSLAEGIKTAFDFQGYGASLAANGRYKPGAAGLGFDGIIALTSEDAGVLGTALGVPTPLTGPLKLRVEASSDDKGTEFKSIGLETGRQKLDGRGSFAGGGMLRLELGGGSLRLNDVLALGVAPWRGQGSAWSDAVLSTTWPVVGQAEITIRPQHLVDPLNASLNEPELVIKGTDQGKDISLVARAESGEPVLVDVKLKPKGAGFTLEGSAHYPVTLDSVTAMHNGRSAMRGNAILEGTFQSEGRSTLSLLSALSGSGTADLADAALNDVAPDRFFAAVNSVKSADEIKQAFEGLLKGEGIPIAKQRVGITAKNGIVTFDTIAADTAETGVKIASAADLAAGNFRSEVAMSAKAQGELPPLRLIYEGSVADLALRGDVAALSDKVGTKLISQDMAELDRLQKQQEQAAKDAEAQAAADKAKFEAFQAQRAELRLQLKALKVHAAQRELDAARYKASLDAAVGFGQSIAKDEKRRLLRLVPAN